MISRQPAIADTSDFLEVPEEPPAVTSQCRQAAAPAGNATKSFGNKTGTRMRFTRRMMTVSLHDSEG